MGVVSGRAVSLQSQVVGFPLGVELCLDAVSCPLF